jgi:hypothetical protein
MRYITPLILIILYILWGIQVYKENIEVNKPYLDHSFNRLSPSSYMFVVITIVMLAFMFIIITIAYW